MKFFTALWMLFSTVAFSLPNPASQYCLDNDGQLETRSTLRGHAYTLCTFIEYDYCREGTCELRSECEEWAYYAQRCKKNQCLRIEMTSNEAGEMSSRCIS